MYVDSGDLDAVETLRRLRPLHRRRRCRGTGSCAPSRRLAAQGARPGERAAEPTADCRPGPRQKVYGGTLGPFLGKVDPLFLRRSRLNMYGGTTNHFGFWARPLDETDFLPRQGYRSAAWPIPRASLDPWYAEANAYGRYGPFNYHDLAFWERVLGGAGFPRKTGGSS